MGDERKGMTDWQLNARSRSRPIGYRGSVDVLTMIVNPLRALINDGFVSQGGSNVAVGTRPVSSFTRSMEPH